MQYVVEKRFGGDWENVGDVREASSAFDSQEEAQEKLANMFEEMDIQGIVYASDDYRIRLLPLIGYLLACR